MSTTELAGIGLKAIEYKDAVDARRDAAFEFDAACSKWKEGNGVSFIERGSEAWNQMLGAVAGEIETVKKAKAAERNTRERLFRAVRRAA